MINDSGKQVFKILRMCGQMLRLRYISNSALSAFNNYRDFQVITYIIYKCYLGPNVWARSIETLILVDLRKNFISEDTAFWSRIFSCEKREANKFQIVHTMLVTKQSSKPVFSWDKTNASHGVLYFLLWIGVVTEFKY